MAKALSIIQGEHRNLGALLSCLDDLIDEIDVHGKQPDFRVFHAILNYIDSFLDRFHHPKEDAYLFPAVRRRCPEVEQTLQELEEQHRAGVALLGDVRKALAAYEYAGADAFEEFRAAMHAYVRFEREHAYKEEREVLSLAREHLTADDWAEIDGAFSANEDPLFGDKRKKEYDELFKRIANLAPAPYGVGPAWE